MTIPTAVRIRMNESSQDVPVFELITITHADLDNPLRYVNNNPNESVISQGNLYVAFPFELILPNRDEDLPRARISVGNVNRRIGEILRQIITPLEVEIKLAYADDLDNPFETYSGFKLRNVEWNGITVEGELQDDDLSQEPIPSMRVTQDRFQGLFRL